MSQWRKLPILFRKRGSCSLISHILKVYVFFVLYPMLMCFVYLICVKTLREYVDGFPLSFTVSEINERGYNLVFNFHTILMQMTKYSFVWVIYESNQKTTIFYMEKRLQGITIPNCPYFEGMHNCYFQLWFWCGSFFVEFVVTMTSGSIPVDFSNSYDFPV